MRENLTARICLIGLDARKFSCAKISTFTVFRAYVMSPRTVLQMQYILLIEGQIHYLFVSMI